jgi:hypothetical protein
MPFDDPILTICLNAPFGHYLTFWIVHPGDRIANGSASFEGVPYECDRGAVPIVLFDRNSVFHTKWAAQYVAAADPFNRRSAPLSGGLSTSQIRDTIVKATQSASGGNEMIFAVGHGGSLGMSEGTVDLAPNKTMRLARGNQPPTLVDPFYDWIFQHPGVKGLSAN